MKKIFKQPVIILIILLFASSCAHQEVYYNLPARRSRKVETGLERFARDYALKYRGKNIAIVTNHSGVDSNLKHIVGILRDRGIIVNFALAPEHGLYGYKNYYDKHKYDVDEKNNIIVYHLHHFNKKSLSLLFKVPDAVIFDIQDMGMRCYTYVSSLKLVMDAMEGTGKQLIILDRPNPISFLGVDGPALDKRFYSKHIASFPSTMFYGMTPGEAARFYRGEYLKKLDLKVVPLSNYDSRLLYNETGLPWVPPSPNLPTYKSAILYTSLVLMEGINVSMGRGTSNPFELLGAPWIDPDSLCEGLTGLNLRNFRFRPVYFKPTISVYENTVCGGVHIYYTGGSFSPTEVSFKIIKYLQDNHDQFRWRERNKKYIIDNLSGTDMFRTFIADGKDYPEFKKAISGNVESFRKKRTPYLLY